MDRLMEIADVLSKTEIVAKLKQMKKASAEMEQRQATSILREKSTADPKRTKKSGKSDLLIITKDKDSSEEKKKFKKDEDKEQDESRDEQDDSSSGHLDVTA